MSGWRILTEVEVQTGKLITESCEYQTTETAPYSEALASALEAEAEARHDSDSECELWGFDAHGTEWRVRLLRGES